MQLLVQNKLTVKEYPKFEVEFGGQKYLVVNDVTIRNTLPNTALRFQININLPSAYPLVPGDSVLVGDGLVVSTSFGSSGYFFSIAKRTFDEGYGIAFNNLHNADVEPLFFDKGEVAIKVIRGPGSLAMDNNPQIFDLKDNEVVKVTPSKEVTRILSP